MQSDNYGVIPGSLKEIYSIKDHKKWIDKQPSFQVINLKLINETSDKDKKYRCVLSDGEYSAHCVISNQHNSYLDDNQFAKLSIISLKDYTLVKTSKRILLLQDLEVKIQRSNKIGSDLIQVDSYYEDNKNDDLAAKLFDQDQKSDIKQQEPDGINVTSIDNISPFQNTWCIRGRLSYKGDMRTWSNARGEGKLFNVNFLDESEEIRATAFNEVAEKLYKSLEEGKVYYVSKAKVVPAKPKFSRLSHTYELSLDKDTEITECFNTNNVPSINFNFTKLNKLKEIESNTLVDVIGVLKTVNPAGQITAKSTGKPFDRRNITIVDDSNFAIDVTLWNNTAVEFSIPEGSVVAFKGVKTNDFGGRSLSLTPGSTMIANPDANESYQLKGWYDNQGVNENFQTLKTESNGQSSIASRKTIQQAQLEELGTHERPDYFSIKATINHIRNENISYPACINEVGGGSSQQTLQNVCNRKIVDIGDNTWRCEKCDKTYTKPYYRYIINSSVLDHTGQIWLTFFDSDATKILGISANDLMALKSENDQQFQQILSSAISKEFSIRVKARQETYNNVPKIRYQATGISEINFNAEIDELTKELDLILVN